MDTITIIPIRLTSRAFIAVRNLNRPLTDADLDKIHAAFDPEDYEVVTIEAMPSFSIPPDDPSLDELPQVEMEAFAAPTQSMAARAREIGISEQTLHRWRKEIDVFDDYAVRKLISSRRSHLWQVADKFKGSLSSD